MQVDLDIEKSKLLVKDVLFFMPSLQQQPAFANPDDVWYINSHIKGRLADLRIEALQVQGLQNTKLDMTGRIAGLPNMNKISADLVVRNISTSRSDMNLFLPQNAMPSNIRLPATIKTSGTIKANTGTITTDLLLATDLGDATIKGVFNEIDDPARMGYNAKIETRSLDIGTILQNKEIGKVSVTLIAKGNGIDPKIANAVFNGTVHSALLKQYEYKDLKINGNIADQKANVIASIVDPNIHFALNATANFYLKYPAVKLSGMIDIIKLQPLHLTSQQMIYRGKIDADFPVTNPDDLKGKLFLIAKLVCSKRSATSIGYITTTGQPQ